MPKLSVPLTDEQHRAIKVKAAETGLPQAEVARRLLLAWVEDDVDLPGHEEPVNLDDYEFEHGPGYFGMFPKGQR